jgi:hypothetical protein
MAHRLEAPDRLSELHARGRVREREIERAFRSAEDLVRGCDAAEEEAAAARLLRALLGDRGSRRVLRIECDLVDRKPPGDRHRLERQVFDRDDRRAEAGPVDEHVRGRGLT